MRVRVLFRTHYQIDEPAHFLLLIQGCTSATRSEYPERVASRLANLAKFNEAAALYAVELARAAEFVNERMIWTPLGLVLALVSRSASELQSSTDLALAERLAVLRAFLESDGACLLWLARALGKGEITASEEASNPVARDMFLDIYAGYLEVMQDLSERQRLRGERDRLSRDGFQGKTGKHKLWLHLEVLHRTGLCDRAERDGSRVYRVATGLEAPSLKELQRALPDVSSLERASASGECGDIACRLLRDPSNDVAAPLSAQAIQERVRAIVRSVRALGLELAPIATIADVLQFRAMAQGEFPPKSDEIRDAIQAMHRAEPRRVRLHVDRNGRPAFLVIDD